MADQVRLRIEQVTLERFKAAFRPEPIPLTPFSVVIGRNGSGKSTLLEAIQWLDTTMRQDARIACDRYHGIHDLINLRSQAKQPYFELAFALTAESRSERIRYRVKVAESDDTTPEIVAEDLTVDSGVDSQRVIWTERGVRRIRATADSPANSFSEPDRLALARAGGLAGDAWYLTALRQFWQHAVFLRLSTIQLAVGSPAKRKSFEPLLDEEGRNLPALLNDLSRDQIEELVATMQTILPDIQDVEVSKPTSGRDERVHYVLKEKMPYRGRTGRFLLPILAWMLSEGTRRITALLALIHHDPLPSLLCVEEIENGLDPWTVVEVLKHLQSAATRGVQVLVTTHSPWLLDHVPARSILHVERTEGETVYRPFADREEVKRLIDRLPPGMVYTDDALQGQR